jgi:hypothetical protein
MIDKNQLSDAIIHIWHNEYAQQISQAEAGQVSEDLLNGNLGDAFDPLSYHLIRHFLAISDLGNIQRLSVFHAKSKANDATLPIDEHSATLCLLLSYLDLEAELSRVASENLRTFIEQTKIDNTLVRLYALDSQQMPITPGFKELLERLNLHLDNHHTRRALQYYLSNPLEYPLSIETAQPDFVLVRDDSLKSATIFTDTKDATEPMIERAMALSDQHGLTHIVVDARKIIEGPPSPQVAMEITRQKRLFIPRGLSSSTTNPSTHQLLHRSAFTLANKHFSLPSRFGKLTAK